MASEQERLKQAREELGKGNREAAAKILIEVADKLSGQGDYKGAAGIYEEAAQIYRENYMADECFQSFDNAILMYVRQGSEPETLKEIVRVAKMAANIAEEAEEFKRAADYYFRGTDFATDEEKEPLLIGAADALENLADVREEEGRFEDAVSLLKKVGRLFFSVQDEELGERIYERAIKLAHQWADTAKGDKDYVSAGNALAEAAQIMQSRGESPESPRLLMAAGGLYEQAGLLEKAGNIYDAAREAYVALRNTSARKMAMTKAAEAYLKMEGRQEIVAPLLMKAGALFKELGSVKAKWAYKRANEIFQELASKAAKDGETESEKTYLRYRAMCLREWGSLDEAEAVYRTVIDYFLTQAKNEAEQGNKENQAVSLEEAAKVLLESGQEGEARTRLEEALGIYVDLAEEAAEGEQPDEASKHYSKAATCAMNLGNNERAAELHEVASEKALRAAKLYEELDVGELAVIWIRTAGMEALKTNNPEFVDKAIGLFRQSSAGFEKIKEPREAFEDIFTIFETLFLHRPDARSEISAVLLDAEQISRHTRDDRLMVLSAILIALDSGSHVAALLALQEREEELADKRDRIVKLIEQSKLVRKTETEKAKGRTHWLYK
ncbi:MAG: tetratricopeptide repeat protein [Candidatus Thorarchaeota archaeon]|nr:MAG: tetratricopeptide repeat protein [Candidatus Thorarchaeota archaeon]